MVTILSRDLLRKITESIRASQRKLIEFVSRKRAVQTDEQEPSTSASSDAKKKKIHDEFREVWLREFGWLDYTDNMMTCTVCKKTDTKSSSKSKARNAFVEGSIRFQKSALSRHEFIFRTPTLFTSVTKGFECKCLCECHYLREMEREGGKGERFEILQTDKMNKPNLNDNSKFVYISFLFIENAFTL